MYDPFGSWVQDYIREIRREPAFDDNNQRWVAYLTKEPASENALTSIEPINDWICVLFHRGSEYYERIPSGHLGRSHDCQRSSARTNGTTRTLRRK